MIIKKDKGTIASVNAINMFLSIKLPKIKKGSKVLCKENYHSKQENHQYITGDHPF